MVSFKRPTKGSFKRLSRRSDFLLIGFATALVGAFALPFLSGTHSCPVLKEREPGTTSSAMAVPAFARKYNVDCTYCHTVWPQLNRTGLTFRYLGYRMPYEVPTQPGTKRPLPTSSRAPGGPAGGGPQTNQSGTGGGAPPRISAPPTPAMIENGRKVATQMQCMTCHVDGGNVVNPNKPIKGAGFLARYPDNTQIAAVIRHGVVGTAMPAYGTDRLSDDQLEDLMAYIRSLTPKSP